MLQGSQLPPNPSQEASQLLHSLSQKSGLTPFPKLWLRPKRAALTPFETVAVLGDMWLPNKRERGEQEQFYLIISILYKSSVQQRRAVVQLLVLPLPLVHH